MRRLTHGSRTMSKLPRPGRARRWSAAGREREPVAGHARRSACRLCLSLARRLRPTRARSTAVRLVLAAFARAGPDVRHGGLRECAACATACAPAASRNARRSAWGSRRAFSRRRCGRRDARSRLLARLGSDASATLLVGIGRFSAEKRWDMVIRAVGEAGRDATVGLLLIGDGPQAARSSSCSRTACAASRCCRGSTTGASSPGCSQAPMRSSTAARPRLSAWSLPRRARAACR